MDVVLWNGDSWAFGTLSRPGWNESWGQIEILYGRILAQEEPMLIFSTKPSSHNLARTPAAISIYCRSSVCVSIDWPVVFEHTWSWHRACIEWLGQHSLSPSDPASSPLIRVSLPDLPDKRSTTACEDFLCLNVASSNEIAEIPAKDRTLYERFRFPPSVHGNPQKQMFALSKSFHWTASVSVAGPFALPTTEWLQPDTE